MIDRDKIDYSTIDVGSILLVHPGGSSHGNEPYKVKVIESTSAGFKTKLVEPEKFKGAHIRSFSYRSLEWEHYHQNRFEIIKK